MFFFSQGELTKITTKLLPENRRNAFEIDKNILNLLQQYPKGLRVCQIARILGITEATVKNHIEAGGILNELSILKGKIKIENDKISLKTTCLSFS